jgi:hypothetical protein
MQIKLKKRNTDGEVRIESSGEIKEIFLNEDFLNPEQEKVTLGFRGKDSSGLVELSPAEIEQIFESLLGRIHVMKGFRRLYRGGALILKK